MRKKQITKDERSKLWLLGMMIHPAAVRQELQKICPKWEESEIPRHGDLDKWYILTECEDDCTKCNHKKGGR